jgi:(1->4)-alpha-D-glucan 1-alpha-D-glucosylmutase
VSYESTARAKWGLLPVVIVPPVATYRIQLTPAFGFDRAAAVVGDLASLGISHLYLSPVAEAVSGSTHGYDVVDPSVVRAELGGTGGLRRLAEAARAHGMGVVVDIVPNHVSTAEPARNPWWWALLRDGPDGPTAAYFDVDWELTAGKVLVPVLGRPLDEVLEAGELDVDGDLLRYGPSTFPLRPGVTLDAAGGGAADLATLLDLQHYRLEHWRSPRRNVRRFFTIDDLVAIRPEVPDVASAVHRIVQSLCGDDLVDGVRVDHVDGLGDPAAYLASLRAVVGDRWLLVEKIVVGEEWLPTEWPVDGTTGYEWITLVDHVFTHPRGERPLTELWQSISGEHRGYHEIEADGVRHVLTAALRPDLGRVARAGSRLLDVPADTLVEPLIELTVRLGRYRTYLREDGPEADDATRLRALVEPADDPVMSRLVEAIIDGNELTRRWQQLTGAALAKGGEDRALYRWLRLAAHNEVGGDPGRWTTSVADFHRHNAVVAERWPATMLAASTHDTKRSEDARARLLVLAEIPERWADAVRRWRDELDPPGGTSLLLALQTALAAWPIDADRLGEYLVKAAREAGERTSWTDPDEAHEAALREMAGQLNAEPLASSIAALIDDVEPAARSISLAQTVLRLTAPGVPDLYQGAQGWLRTLVDPDNRGPLDAAGLRAAAGEAGATGPVWDSPAPKAAVIARTLAARRRHLDCFGAGSGYVPSSPAGAHRDHVVAFARTDVGGGPAVVAVAARFPLSRPDGWRDTTVDLPPGRWHDVLGDARYEGGPVGLAELLGAHPAALLERTG